MMTMVPKATIGTVCDTTKSGKTARSSGRNSAKSTPQAMPNTAPAEKPRSVSVTVRTIPSRTMVRIRHPSASTSLMGGK